MVNINDNGEIHCENGPAVTNIDGYEQWLINGNYHRIGGPAVIIPMYREKQIFGYQKEWWVNGKLHRLDGPAVEYYFGDKAWFIEGIKIETFLINDKNSSDKWDCMFIIGKDDPKWQLLKANPEQIIYFRRTSKEMQEFAIQERPDLITKIPNLHEDLKKRYKHELSLAGIEI